MTCFAALFLGQAILRLSGARSWNWLAPAVGLSALMLVATPANHIPGRAATLAVLLALLSLAAAVWCLRSPAHRPDLAGLTAALPVAALAAVPFLAVDRGGILGVTVNNDMAVHLVFVESYLSAQMESVAALPSDYPLGPHAVSAVLAEGLGLKADIAFSAFTMALPIVGAWALQSLVRGGSWFGRVVLATVAGMPYLVAAYYGQGSFKEVAQAVVVVAVALYLAGCGPRLGRGRWVPFAVLVGGVISCFSLPGLPWPTAFFGLWLAGLLAIAARRGKLREVPAAVRRELPALAVGVGVLVLVLAPQAGRMADFLSVRNGGSGIALDNLGNLVAPLPGWEVLAWNSPDFRLPASSAFDGGYWSIFVLALVLFGAYWAFRRGRWMLPLAAAAAMLIWAVSKGSQSPYVVAKGLVVAAPLVLLLAALPLVDGPPDRRRRLWPWLAIMALGLVLFLRVGKDDLRVLRFSPVGPETQSSQLEGFRAQLADKRTLFLGNSEFVRWQLSGVPVEAVALANLPLLPLRAEKGWEEGEAIDFDTVPVATLNEYEWIVSPNDAAGSAAPAQLELVDESEDFLLWHRVGRIPERSILGEEEWPGAVLRCATPRGRAVLAGGGVAAVRPLPVVAPVPDLPAGGSAAVRLRLAPGGWELETPYASPLPVEVSAPGLDATLPPNLERAGQRHAIGRVESDGTPLTVEFDVGDTLLAPPTAAARFKFLVAVPEPGAERVVPVAQACGRYVDWYRPAGG